VSEVAAVTVPSATAPLVVGRYALFDELAAGGMATVHLGRLLGPVGFGRTVAVKRLHDHYLADQEFLTMFMDEARVAARIRHPNVVPMVDVVQSGHVLLLVMDYVHGESLSRLIRAARAAGGKLPYRVTTAIIYGALLGLHAAHETRSATGELLGVVHRDVSPQNIMVGADGIARVLDFGIAKAAGRAQVTREGQIKGKLAYMAPEQVRGQVDRRTDIFAAAVCLWEALAGKRLHEGMKDVEIVTRVITGKFTAPSLVNADVPPALDAIVLRGLDPNPDKRFLTARDMAIEIERTVGLATPSEVSEVVERLAADALRVRNEKVHAIELAAAALAPPDPVPSALDPPQPPPQWPEGNANGTANGAQEDENATATTNGGATAEIPITVAPQQMQLTPGMMIAVVVSLLLALTGMVLGGWSIAARAKANAAPPPSASATPLPPPSAPPSVMPQIAPPAPSPTPTISAAPPTTTTATATATTSASAAPQRPVFVAPPQPRPAPTRPGCNPPFTIDENQHKHYKPECFDTF
jgi:serine/threonine-protein kinase